MTNTLNKIMHDGDEYLLPDTTYTAWTWIAIDSNNEISNTLPWAIVSATAPSSPTEWMVWYDTTNDVLKTYDWTNWNVVWDDAADINTKTFYLSSYTDYTTATAAYNWRLAWKNAIIYLNGTFYDTYSPSADITSAATWETSYITAGISSSQNNSQSNWFRNDITFQITNWSVTRISSSEMNINGSYFLSTMTYYSNPYTPLYDGSPATKKYVDDTVWWAISSWTTAPSNPVEWQLWYDTTNDVLKTYDGTNWNEVGWGWDVVVSSQPNNILTSWMKIRAWTETNYWNLGTYDSNCLYLVIE